MGVVCFSIGIVLFLHGWSLVGFSGYSIWFELLGLLLSAIGFVISFYGATAGLVKPEWVCQETPGYQKLIVKVLGYLGLALGLFFVLLVIVALALWLTGYI